MQNLNKFAKSKISITLFLISFSAVAQKNNCVVMAEMANNVANLRDAGVSIITIQQRLKRDVLNQEELALGILVTRIVYRTSGTGKEIKKAVMKSCKQ